MGYTPDLIFAARHINNGISKFIAEKIIKEMIYASKLIKGSNALFLGVTFKENCGDMRNTKVIDIIKILTDLGISVDIYDPWVNTIEVNEQFDLNLIGSPLKLSKKYDVVVAAVAHKQFLKFTENDYDQLSSNPKIIIDIKNFVPNPTWRL